MDGTRDMTMQDFVPSAETARDFRDALGRFATGVTVITAQDQTGKAVGITANSFASVSLDPALVLWSPAKTSNRYDVFMQAHHYAVHVLAADQEALCMGFVKDGHTFDNVDYSLNDKGVAVLNGCLARFECTQEAVHDAGDHSIIVGRVTRAAIGQGEPLLFSAGKFGRFAGA